MAQRLPNRGLLFVFEGIDGAGKTTQANALARHIASLGYEAIQSKEPTNGQWGQKLRESASKGRLPAKEELELFIADRREHVSQLVEPALADGKIIIIDRYYYSTAAYQGARGMDYAEILELNRSFAPTPDLLFILQVSPTTGRERIAKRGDEANHFEGESALAASAAIFDRIEGDYVRKLDGMWSISELEHSILQAAWHAIDSRVRAAAPVASASFTGVDLLVDAGRVLKDDSIKTEDKAQALLNRLVRA